MKKEISSEDIEKLGSFDSPTISNAIETFSVRDNTVGYASMELKCLTPESKPMVGYAVTATLDSTTPGPIKGGLDKMRELFDLIKESHKPLVVVYKYVGSDRYRSCSLGDMVATTYQKFGISGIVTDCGIRDLSGIKKRAPGFHIFSPGLVVSHGIGNFIELNTTVTICGLTIKPGDLLHGDESGVVNVPIDFIDIKTLITKAESVIKWEQDYFSFLESSEATFENIKKRLMPQ